MKQKQGFCYEIFKNQAFWSHNQSVSYNPCSFFDGFIDHDMTPKQSWFGHNHKKIIELVEQDRLIPGCHRCYKEEAARRLSRRQSSKQNYETFLDSADISNAAQGPEGLDYSVGNLCNLRCIICGPQNSSAWIPDYQKIYPDRNIQAFQFRKNLQTEIIDDNFLKNVKSIHFHGGGEPLMSTAHFDLLQRVDQVKGLQDVRVFYNTNGTQTVDDSVLRLWEKCRLIELYFSIDDIGKRFEYQRTGAKWSEVQNNIEWFKINMPHNHMFKINCVWGYLNLYYLDELYQWYQNTLPANRYGDPCNLIFQKAIGIFRINHLGHDAISFLKEKFKDNNQLLQLLVDIKVENNDHTVFWKAIEKIDSVRSNKFSSVCPEWSKFL
jgi:hypothetical protein